MARFPLVHGSHIETLTQDELKHHLDQQTVGYFQEMARGLSTFRFDSFATVAGASVTLPASGALGPELGFAWSVQRITADNLGAADVLHVYRNVATPGNLLGTITAGQSFHAGSKGAILRSDERLVITGTALTATGDITVNGEGLEVPELSLYKIL
jgi:hypothetical protein